MQKLEQDNDIILHQSPTASTEHNVNIAQHLFGNAHLETWDRSYKLVGGFLIDLVLMDCS
jgi:hypothetical protein